MFCREKVSFAVEKYVLPWQMWATVVLRFAHRQGPDRFLYHVSSPFTNNKNTVSFGCQL